ncbi:MAG: SRPBCC family protein [Acidobacteria bacterium]|nr:SRPBCC family protein [Acidobacteriota bacterium]
MGKRYTVSASARVGAPAEVVYNIIADYRNGHPQILPKKYFEWLEVEQGGRGEGTVIRFQMRVLGQSRVLRAAVTEPEPGRVLVETDTGGDGPVTTFTVEPEGPDSRVTFSTVLTSAGGPLGALERFVLRRVLRRVYAAELEQLSRVAAERTSVQTVACWASLA